MITFSRLGRYGQLGNQLFQYAMLRGVGTKCGYEIRVPKNYTAPKKAGLVELQPFNIRAHILPGTYKPKHTYQERGHEFHPDVFKQPDGTDFRGYFQSEKYFQHCSAIIREELRMDVAISQAGAVFLQGVRGPDNRPVVSVHVRRGDYLENPHLFRIMSGDWYAAAMAWPEFAEAAFVVFSDDLDWCTSVFKTFACSDRIQYYSGQTHWHDLSTMSQCDHHIIAPSSFSWWGAWLNPKPGKIVIAPKPWFGPKMGHNEQDIVPACWFQLE